VTEYKLDSIDSLLEDSLFKKKRVDVPLDEDPVEKALHAHIDPSAFDLEDEIASPKKKSVVRSEDSSKAHERDMGSSILFGAINDLDLDGNQANNNPPAYE
jgi:hypothetical protein